MEKERRKKRQEERHGKKKGRNERGRWRMEDEDPPPRERIGEKRMAEEKQECPFFHTRGTHVSFN